MWKFACSIAMDMKEVVDDFVVYLKEEKMIEIANSWIEGPTIEEAIKKDNVAWNYLKEGGLILFMKSFEQHNEKVS